MADKDGKMAINGPVFFLVQEQAKSVVAIQALQTRMAVLESLQERLMQAIDDVQQHLRTSKETQNSPTVSKSYAKKSSLAAGEKKLRFAESKNKSGGAGTKADLSKTDSYNKDSGLGNSDCSLVTGDHHSLQEEDDELLQLLELIDQKSLSLVKQVEGASISDVSRSEMENSSSSMLDTLLFEKVNTQRQLSEVKAELDELRERLAKLELATHAVNKQKLKVQQQLDATLIENQSLQTQIVQSSDSERRTESLGYMVDIEKANIKKNYLKYSEKSRIKVSSILKQTNVLELQKQLLAYVMENDILRAKLHQEEPSRVSSWLKIESDLRKKSKEMSDEKHKFKEILQTKNLEIASLKDRIHQLEDQFVSTDGEDESCVKNFGMRSTEDWREPGAHNLYNKRNNLNNESPFSPLGYGDFSKTQSLPPLQFLDVKAQRKKDESMRVHLDHIYDTGNFTEVPLHVSPHSQQQSISGQDETASKDLVDLSIASEPQFSTTSTLVQSSYAYQNPPHSRLSAPNLSNHSNHLQNWAFASRKSNNETGGSAKLVNGHLCWKGAERDLSPESDDITSICTEFDPLSDDNSACEQFVDSLNLSIPLKPTQVNISQLSSIGDSLHSNSLDLGCGSTPVLYKDTRKVSNARSVDGIRELLLEKSYSKRSGSLQFGHSNRTVLGKTTRKIPVNIMNCMHESSDYSLL